MTIKVLRPGMLTTVQDLGRVGMQRFGVVVGGAMDPPALRIANLLVGNEPHEAGLEMTLLGPTLEFQQDAIISLCGGPMEARVEKQRVPSWRPVFLRAGSLLTCGPITNGCRAYLAVAGGLDVPVVLDSRSTYLRAGIGGLAGSALKAEDTLSIRTPTEDQKQRLERMTDVAPESPVITCRWSAGPPLCYDANPTVRVLRGNEHSWLTPQSQQKLFSAEFNVTSQSDRMGYRLSGQPLELETPRELLSEAVCPGTIQVPADGQPILLMADCQPTGGYAKVAHVIRADLPLVAQLQPGARLRFKPVTLGEAHDALRRQENSLQQLRQGIEIKLREGPWHAAST